MNTDGNTLIVSIYVDALVLIGNNVDLLFRLKCRLVDTFENTYLGILHFFLCIQVLSLLDGLFVSQSKYAMCWNLEVLRGGGRGGESVLDNFKIKLLESTIAHITSTKQPRKSCTIHSNLRGNPIWEKTK